MPEKILELLKVCHHTKEQIAEKLNVSLPEVEAAMGCYGLFTTNGIY